MHSSPSMYRIIPVLLIVPLALLLGVLLTDMSRTHMLIVGAMVGGLFLPLLLKWHHQILVISWNAAINAFFLPGQPSLWMLMGFLSFGVSFLAQVIDRKQEFEVEWSVGLPLIFLSLVVIVTARLNGFGLRLLGGETFGGGKYLTVIAAIVGFFALSARAIPRRQGWLFVSVFLLVGVIAVLSNLVYLAGPNLYWLFLVFPAKHSLHLSLAESSAVGGILRFGGLAASASAVCMYLLCRFGVRQIFRIAPAHLMIWFLPMLGLSFLGGFRSTFLFFVVLMGVLFVLEKAYKSSALPIVLAIAVLGLAMGVYLVDRLPASVQRVMTIVPGIKVASNVRVDADYSIQWRLDLWNALLPQIPKYFWVGKGLGMNQSDYYLMREAEARGYASPYEWAIITGDYHNGGLTLLIPFGVFGLLAFVWFLAASLKILYRHHRHGDPNLKLANSFLLALFGVKTLFFFMVYGQFQGDLAYFCGIIGLSISLNREWNRHGSESSQLEGSRAGRAESLPAGERTTA